MTTELVLEQSSSIGELQVGATDLWWSELRPRDGGRIAIVRHRVGTGQANLLRKDFSARTRVHEYGGGAWWLHGDVLFFTNWSDQRLYRHYGDHDPEPLTPAYGEDVPARYADGRVTADGRWVVCVRELHASSVRELGGEATGAPAPEPRNEIVAVEAHEGGEPIVLVTGPDFVSSPRFSPNGQQMVWLQWNHPDMPWDGTELWIATIDDDPDGIAVSNARRVAGSRDESIGQPTWLADGSLVFVSDRTDWWNLYRVTAADALAATATTDADAEVLATLVGAVEGEIGQPQWVFGQTRFAELEDGRLLCAVAQRGVDRLGLLDLGTDTWTWLDTPLTAISSVVAFGSGAAVVGASFREETAVRLLDLSDPAAPVVTVVNRTPERPLDRRYLSVAEPIDFATTGGAEAHALYYAPVNPDVVGPPDGLADERPPLVVLSHGGPTAAARAQLNLGIQYWTSRGIAVVDVNYRGSVGYGRRYRHALDGQWGIADVDDCIAAARFLVDRGDVDGARLAIRGGSAGGFTTLCAVTFHDVFGAGASLYGVADLEALTRDTHKFESRYLDRLIGPWPEAKALYDERSPIAHTDQLSTPLIVFQGLDDAIVPPAQAEAMVAALQDKGVPHAYLAFEGEQHGFRQAANIARVLEAELSFYGQIFGFDVDVDIEPVAIANL